MSRENEKQKTDCAREKAVVIPLIVDVIGKCPKSDEIKYLLQTEEYRKDILKEIR